MLTWSTSTPRSVSSSSTSRQDRPKRRYQRTARTMASDGNRKPENADRGGTTWRGRRILMAASLAARRWLTRTQQSLAGFGRSAGNSVSSFIVATMIGLLEIPRPGTNAYLWPACAWITERSDDGAPWTAVGTVRTRADRPRAGRARGGCRRGRDAPIVVWLQGRRAAHDLRCPSKSAQEGRPASKSTDGDGRSTMMPRRHSTATRAARISPRLLRPPGFRSAW